VQKPRRRRGFIVAGHLLWQRRHGTETAPMPRTRQAHRSEIPLDTLGKLADRGYRPFGSCLDCARRYRYELGARNRPSQYDIDLGALVAERGRDCLIVGMEPVLCPRCGSRRTELRVLPPQTSRVDVVHSANENRLIR
jgi:hypothetical protein